MYIHGGVALQFQTPLPRSGFAHGNPQAFVLRPTQTAGLPAASTQGIYACGAVGRDRHYRRIAGRDPASGAGRARGGPPHAVPQQPEADGVGRERAFGRAQVFSDRRLGLDLGRRPQLRLRPQPTGRLDVQHPAVCRRAGAARSGQRRRREQRPAENRDQVGHRNRRAFVLLPHQAPPLSHCPIRTAATTSMRNGPRL